MKVLFVYSGNNDSQPFIREQIKALKDTFPIDVSEFKIKGKGHFGYLKSLLPYQRKISEIRPHLVHAHYGLSGLLASLQFRVPLITTFHGTDVNYPEMLFYSKIAFSRSRHAIMVEPSMASHFSNQRKITVIPCGIDLSTFYPIDKAEARTRLGISSTKKVILFSSSFTNPVKNYSLAAEAVTRLNSDIDLIELKGMTRHEVNLWLNAADVALMTSFTEGSPQFIKEAMATNCPVVSTNVGDVSRTIDQVPGCYITSFDATDVSEKLRLAFLFGSRTQGQNRVENFDNNLIATKIWSLYNTLLDCPPPKPRNH